MKNMKKLMMIAGSSMMLLATSATVFASTGVSTPTENVELSENTRTTNGQNKMAGQRSKHLGHGQMQTALLENLVDDGYITQEQADAFTTTTSETKKPVFVTLVESGALTEEELAECQAKQLAERKTFLQERVDSGEITQDQADAWIESMETRQKNCDGTGEFMGFGMGQKYGKGRVCQTTTTQQ